MLVGNSKQSNKTNYVHTYIGKNKSFEIYLTIGHRPGCKAYLCKRKTNNLICDLLLCEPIYEHELQCQSSLVEFSSLTSAPCREPTTLAM
jgi:hypothetical protein